MYHVNISLVRQINVKVNPWQNCQISISSVVRMARTNKFPINNRQIPKVPFSYSPLNSRWSHPPTRRLFTFIVNNIPSHVSIIIVFVIIALLQSNDEHFHRLIYIYIFKHFYHLFYHRLLWFFFLFFTFSQSSSNEQQTLLSIQPHDRDISESYHLRVCFRSTFTLLFIYLFIC